MVISRRALTPIDFGGLQIFDYTAGHTVSSSMAVIEVPPGARHAAAWSKRSDKFYMLVAGTLRFVLDGTAHDLIAGDFCLVRQGQRFSYANDGTAAATLVLVHTPSFDLASEVFVAA